MGHLRGNHTLMFLSLSFSLPSPLSKNEYIKSFLKIKKMLLRNDLGVPLRQGLPVRSREQSLRRSAVGEPHRWRVRWGGTVMYTRVFRTWAFWATR